MKPANPPRKPHGKIAPEETGPLTGKLIVSNFVLSGGGLTRPLVAPKITLEPVTASNGSSSALAGTVAIPAGGTAPLTFNLRLAPSGYRVGVMGQAGIARAREIAHAAGIPGTDVLASLAGEPHRGRSHRSRSMAGHPSNFRPSLAPRPCRLWLPPLPQAPEAAGSALTEPPLPIPSPGRSPCATPTGRPIISPTTLKSPMPHCIWTMAFSTGIRLPSPTAR